VIVAGRNTRDGAEDGHTTAHFERTHSIGEELLSFYEERQLTFSPSSRGGLPLNLGQPFRDKNLNVMLRASDAKNPTQDRYRLQNFCGWSAELKIALARLEAWIATKDLLQNQVLAHSLGLYNIGLGAELSNYSWQAARTAAIQIPISAALD
jgi:hypothetical protein